MSQNNQLALLDELLRETALTVVHLRNGANIEDGQQLYQRCQEQIRTIRERLTQKDYHQDVVDEISYAICALLDETVLLHNSQHGHDLWQGVPLQVTFFNTYNAGEEIYNRIKNLLKQPAPLAIIAACYDRIFSLGFQGKYLNKSQSERDQVMIDLEALLAKVAPQISESFIDTISESKQRWRNKSLFFWTGCSIAAVIAVYIFMQQLLSSSLNQLFSSL